MRPFSKLPLHCTVDKDVHSTGFHMAGPINFDVEPWRVDELQLFDQYIFSSGNMDQRTRTFLAREQLPVPMSTAGKLMEHSCAYPSAGFLTRATELLPLYTVHTKTGRTYHHFDPIPSINPPAVRIG